MDSDFPYGYKMNNYNELLKQSKELYQQADTSTQTLLTVYQPKPFGEKRTYPQDWAIYAKAASTEKLMFLKLLKDAVDHLSIDYVYKGNGRPPHYYGDILKSLCIKAYHNYSSWRLESELRIARAMGIIEFVPKRSTINKYMQSKKITNMLHKLVKILAEPLATIETHFSADASGIQMKYGNKRWIKVRHTKDEIKEVRNYVKLHIISGVKSNVITSVKITPGNKHESPFFKGLLDETVGVFNVKEVSADAGYLSRKNVRAIGYIGAEPYIMPKKNVSVPRKGTGPWVEMLQLWKHNQMVFAQRYHLRSNVESTFGALKRKFGDFCRCKLIEAQENEILSKVVCFNGAILAENILSYDLRSGFLNS